MIHASTLLLALLAWSDPPAASGTPLILDFHAEWCGPCQEMRPAIERLKEKRYPIRSIDIDQSRELARRYKISGVPTFVVVDPEGNELGRTSGAQPASQIATLYNESVTRLAGSPGASADGAVETPSRTALASHNAEGSPPRPWETAVRVKVLGQGAVGFGSGTVIHSTPEESIILTCAHVFKIDGARQQPAPSKFPRKIQIDLFDGILHGQHPKYVHPVETVEGVALDYDFTTDVGLIRIRPGRMLPASPVVPATWKPSPGVAMTTVGCSEGNNASPWSTVITNPSFKGLMGNRRYDAIECQHAPKQGRSGGGLYTIEGYIAGVCNFAEPTGGHGLYASPRSIHQLLDRNELTLCYNPAAGQSGAMLASRTRNYGKGTTVRAQNDALPGFPMPGPDTVGVSLAPLADEAGTTVVASREPLGAAPGRWQAPVTSRRRPPNEDLIDAEPPTALTTDLQMDPAVAGDTMPSAEEFETVEEPMRAERREPSGDTGSWRKKSR